MYLKIAVVFFLSKLVRTPRLSRRLLFLFRNNKNYSFGVRYIGYHVGIYKYAV